MTTMLNIPENVLASADAAAKRLGISRDEFFARAAESMAARFTRHDVTVRIDGVLGETANPLDPALEKAQFETLPDEKW